MMEIIQTKQSTPAFIDNASFVDVFVNTVNQMLIMIIKHILQTNKNINNNYK